ncbi:uracil-DNA glycosylase [Thiolapillus brandeum]|uniref:Type-4 uracil-DNA glycosylase n=1 Tax=Thiolapillus brandeum TaxID=1076588 RepID=A0A7U6JIF4_9GAMM|nr:uracil-DNA glycosylase [Thiolapillus brandeum]BAO44738.1 DNA polymerase bacteriophage-type [Thiolapillus brandeum]
MDSHRRQQYLDALGIVSWVRRDQVVAGNSEPVAVEARPPESVPATETPGQPVSSLGWEALEAAVAGCTACELHHGRKHTVFGVGDHNARLMIIGEAPGAEEDRQGEPFVGRAGQLLNALLRAIGLDRSQVFIANILKCRPPGNRNPEPDEVRACAHFLQRQVALVQPRVILAVGGVAAHNLLQTDDAVGRLRSRIHAYGDDQIPLLVTYHPAYLLRRPEEKAKAWQDLQKLHGLLQVD